METRNVVADGPKYPEYAILQKRLDSYASWASDCPITPAILAQVGLIYTGLGDRVKCYYCGGGLHNWEAEDNPKDEHNRWYPECPLNIPEEDLSVENSVPVRACLSVGYSMLDILKAIVKHRSVCNNNDYTGYQLARYIEYSEEGIDATSEELSMGLGRVNLNDID